MNFQDLLVWQKAKRLAVEVYSACASSGVANDFGLRSQMQRAAVSVASNIAEGYSREKVADRCHLLVVARSSWAELFTQLEIAGAVGLLPTAFVKELEQQGDEVSRMISGLIKTLRAGEAAE